MPEPKEGDLVICETETSTWSYHLRRVGPEGPKFSGGAGTALCGRKVGWDTRIPLATYGEKSHLPERWCAKCAELAGLII